LVVGRGTEWDRQKELGAPHTPVMLEEVLEWLRIKPDGIYIDATLGAGEHSAAIAARLSSGRLISLDRDAQALRIAQERLKEFASKVSLVHTAFSKIAEAVHGLGIAKVDGVLADLGVSSMQLDRPERGFSFREAGPLDMRMSSGEVAEDTLSAEEIVNRWPEKELADLLYREAEEHDSRRIARAIVRARKQWGRQRLHPATKTFLALRIAVNREMEELGQFLYRTPATLNSGGRWVVLTYHSREDRPVKQAFQEGMKAGTLRVLTKHVIVPSEEEQAANQRSRSAKLRCAEKV
jgi:16S rRNA (cytosine1402-N4)-methyltransferase